LLKNGKLNVDSTCIFKADSVGTKDGIYVIEGEDGSDVILSIKGEQIPLLTESTNTYVSFLTA